MKKRIALVVAGLSAAVVVITAAFIGAGLVNASSDVAALAEPTNQPSLEKTATDVATLGLPGFDDSYDDADYTRIEDWIDICMRGAGYSYEYLPATADSDTVGLNSSSYIKPPPGFDDGEGVALYGDPDNTGAAYRWQDGGCYGQAIHKAGVVDAGTAGFTSDEAAQLDAVAADRAEMAIPKATMPTASTPGFSGSFDEASYVEVQDAIRACMADQGLSYEYPPADGPQETLMSSPAISGPVPTGADGRPVEPMTILFGLQSDPAGLYDWQEGGCYGSAVHAAGIAQ